MYTMPFILLNLNGSWCPRSWTSKLSTNLYFAYTVFCFIIYYSIMMSMILDIFLVAENLTEIVVNMVQLVNIVNASQKNLAFLVKRKKICKFIDYFFEEPSKPNTPKEEEIQKKYDDEARGNTIKLFILYTVSVTSVVYLPFFLSDVKDRVLPYRGWKPYTLENVNYYYWSYLHQCYAVTIAAFANGATETLVSGFMIQVSAQFDILEERFMQLPNIIEQLRESGESESEILVTEKNLMKKLILHHLRIYELADLLNDMFVFVIFTQFVSSISVLCVVTYNLAVCTDVSEFLGIFLYFICMLLQIFLYTWYANEITLKSTGLGYQIFLSNWRSLSNRGIKDLMIILERTTKPIILTSGYVIALSNAAFTSIVKTSYSVYNVLSVQ